MSFHRYDVPNCANRYKMLTAHPWGNVSLGQGRQRTVSFHHNTIVQSSPLTMLSLCNSVLPSRYQCTTFTCDHDIIVPPCPLTTITLPNLHLSRWHQRAPSFFSYIRRREEERKRRAEAKRRVTVKSSHQSVWIRGVGARHQSAVHLIVRAAIFVLK